MWLGYAYDLSGPSQQSTCNIVKVEFQIENALRKMVSLPKWSIRWLLIRCSMIIRNAKSAKSEREICSGNNEAATSCILRPVPLSLRPAAVWTSQGDDCTYHLLLLMASPKPGVSTSVSFRLTPPSTKLTVELWTWTGSVRENEGKQLHMLAELCAYCP